MIERTTVNGRPATVTYLKAGFSPADRQAAELIKVVFDDGEALFLVPSKPVEAPT